MRGEGMSEWRIWRREGGMTMLHGQHREVRYAVPSWVQPRYLEGFEPERDIPLRSVRAVGSTEDLPEAQWIPSGEFPVKSLLRLYVPEEEK